MKADIRDFEKMVYLCEPSYDAVSKTLAWNERSWQDGRYKKERYVLSDSGNIKKTTDKIWSTLSEQADGEFREYAVSPDGTHIAYITAKEKEQELLPESWKAPIIAQGDSYRRESDGGWKKERIWKLNICNTQFQDPETLYESTESIQGLFWAPDGSKLVFSDEKNGDCYYAVDTFGNKVCLAKDLFTSLGQSGGCFMLDGKIVLAAGIKGRKTAAGYDLFALASDGNGERSVAWEGDIPDEIFAQSINGSPFPENNQKICLTDSDDTAAVIACKDGETAIYLLKVKDTDGSVHGTWKRLTDGTGSFYAVCKGEEGYLYALYSDWNHPTLLVKVNLSDGSIQNIHNANEWIKEKSLAKTTNFKCRTLDGADTLDGWILEPAEHQSERIPTVLLIHGGPLSAWTDAFTMEAQLLAAAGMGVILVNPRGSSGYGKNYASYEKAFDGTAAIDLLYYTDCALSAFPWMDENRLGVAGGSYGGYMSAWLAGHCKRFRAAVVMRGLLNFEFLYLTSQAAGGPGMYDEPKAFEDFLMKTTLESPNTYAQEMDLPMLIMHGEKDVNCPLDGAHQLYVAVKDNHPDQPVRFIIFPGVGHNIRAARIDYYQRYETELVNWLKKYL